MKKPSKNVFINNKVIIIIPARYGSTRFEGKPLVEIDGVPMIIHVYRRSKKVKNVFDVIVATDDERIRDVVEKFGGRVMMTSNKHQSGTDRVAEVAKKVEADIIVNVQGDEPLINPKAVEEAINPVLEDENIRMSTLMTKITDKSQFNDPNIVKVVTDQNNFALYFSRALIPYPREEKYHQVYKHLGVYVFRKEFLLNFANMQQTALEQIESLEQLRALENGIKIKVVETDYKAITVDTPKDLEIVREYLKKSRG